MREKPRAVVLLTAFFGGRAAWALASLGLILPGLWEGPSPWRILLIYGCAGGYIAYLCWRQAHRTRFSAYVFLSVDLVRAVHWGWWWTALMDLAVIGAMQLPGLRAAYPSVRPTLLTERLRRRPASRQRSKGLPGSNGGSPPSNGRGRILRP